MKDVLLLVLGELPVSLRKKPSDYKTICQILSKRRYQNTEAGQLTESREEKAPQVGDA